MAKRNPVDMDAVMELCRNEIVSAEADVSAIEIAAEQLRVAAEILGAYSKSLRSLMKDQRP